MLSTPGDGAARTPIGAAPLGSEARIGQIGAEILSRTENAGAIFGSHWWEQQVFSWTLAHPQVRARLLRFVDVLPALASSHDVAAHLRSYLLEDGHELPRPLALALRLSSPGSPAGDIAAFAARHNVRQIARRFIAGETVGEATEAIAALQDRGAGAVFYVLGEVVTSDAEADLYTATYLDLIDGLPGAHVALKLSSLDPAFDAMAPAAAAESAGRRLRAILRRAGERGAHVTVDMEQYDTKNLTLQIFRSVLAEPEFRDRGDVGIVLQAYLRDTADDLEELLDWVKTRGAPILVRLVKGAYWDLEARLATQRGWPCPVFLEKWESDAAFEQLARRLLAKRDLVRPAFASHNVRSLSATLATAEQYGVASSEFEFQMLYGMADPLQDALVDRGHAVRVYTPFGPLVPGMAYLIRRLLENASNGSFLRHSFAHQPPTAELLASPTAARTTSPRFPALRAVDSEDDMGGLRFENEPMSDFSRIETRAAMVGALDCLCAESLGRDHPARIGGRAVTTGHWIESRDPSAPDRVVGRAARAGVAEADEAVAAAHGASCAWRETPVADRADLLRRAAAELRRRRFELAAWIVLEVGKGWREADSEVSEAIDFCEMYALGAERLQGIERVRGLPGEENLLLQEPRGVAAVIAPWNFPLATLAGMTTAALATGNTVVLKSAEQSPVVGAMFFEVLVAAGVPDGVVSLLPGFGEDVGARLVEHPQVDVIAFTGSRDVGLGMIEKASSVGPGQVTIGRALTEMGGKNAIIVDTDADLDEAVRGIVESAFGYAGQKCSACSRVIVVDSVHERLVRRLVEATRSLRIGPAGDPESQVGPVIDEESARRIRDAVAAAGKPCFRGQVPDVPGHWVAPVIFDRVDSSADLAREEIFGPVLAVIVAADFDEALLLANDSDCGLTGGLYSRDPDHIERARREFRVGNLCINRGITGALVDRQPFGGSRLSGVGAKAGSPDYLRQFCEARTITEHTLRHGFAPEELH
ncbi:MAG: proline dehydrogenase family protein [Candidatus Binatia bacterium]|nr:proline dehydrogenase family protein [Candidatus Binatia bacterium]